MPPLPPPAPTTKAKMDQVKCSLCESNKCNYACFTKHKDMYACHNKSCPLHAPGITVSRNGWFKQRFERGAPRHRLVKEDRASAESTVYTYLGNTPTPPSKGGSSKTERSPQQVPTPTISRRGSSIVDEQFNERFANVALDSDRPVRKKDDTTAPSRTGWTGVPEPMSFQSPDTPLTRRQQQFIHEPEPLRPRNRSIGSRNRDIYGNRRGRAVTDDTRGARYPTPEGSEDSSDDVNSRLRSKQRQRGREHRESERAAREEGREPRPRPPPKRRPVYAPFVDVPPPVPLHRWREERERQRKLEREQYFTAPGVPGPGNKARPLPRPPRLHYEYYHPTPPPPYGLYGQAYYTPPPPPHPPQPKPQQQQQQYYAPAPPPPAGYPGYTAFPQPPPPPPPPPQAQPQPQPRATYYTHIPPGVSPPPEPEARYFARRYANQQQQPFRDMGYDPWKFGPKNPDGSPACGRAYPMPPSKNKKQTTTTTTTTKEPFKYEYVGTEEA